jgi:hypothetical protein
MYPAHLSGYSLSNNCKNNQQNINIYVILVIDKDIKSNCK